MITAIKILNSKLETLNKLETQRLQIQNVLIFPPEADPPTYKKLSVAEDFCVCGLFRI
jgi:hypothetical protein